MKVVDPVSAVLNQKGREVYSVPPDVTVYRAIELMAEKNVGALLVMENERLVGLISERDYTRKISLQGKTSKKTLVRDIMVAPVITVTPHYTVEECMRLMTEKRVRHLPVVQEDRVEGVISIGNLVNWIITAQNATITHLESYITGQYPG